MTDGFEPLRVGVLGLGRAFTLMLPTLAADPRIQLVACCDPHENATALFRAQFGAQVHESAQALCADPNVEWVYIATPHPLHEAHAALAAAHGKHVLVEKPMALSLLECDRMIHAAQQARDDLERRLAATKAAYQAGVDVARDTRAGRPPRRCTWPPAGLTWMPAALRRSNALIRHMPIHSIDCCSRSARSRRCGC